MDTVLKELATFETPLVSIALDTLEFPDSTDGYAGYDVRALFPELGVMCGRAVTARIDTTTPDAAFDDSKLIPIARAVAELKGPCVVVLKAAGPDRLHTCVLGDQMAALFKRLGAVGAVTDGGVRDLAGMRPIGFQVFAAGTVASHGTFRILDVNCDVEISGMRVRPGDILHGDENGLITVPEEALDRLIETLLERRRVEREYNDFVNSRDFSLEEFARRCGREGTH